MAQRARTCVYIYIYKLRAESDFKTHISLRISLVETYHFKRISMEQATKHLVLISIFIILLNIATNKALSQPLHNPSKHFVLVHGAGHGAWCWYKLVPLLRSSGHNVTTIDLAASGIDPRQISDLQSISDYIRPLRDLLASLPPNEKVILVGHSLGGLALSQTMERLPSKISVAVFLTALMPGPSLNIFTLSQEVHAERKKKKHSLYFLYHNMQSIC